MDIYLAGHIVTKFLQVLVLDEADKMMDMGFMPQINRILEVVPVKRQNLLFSATMSDKVQQLSANFLEYPTDYRGNAAGYPCANSKPAFVLCAQC